MQPQVLNRAGVIPPGYPNDGHSNTSQVYLENILLNIEVRLIPLRKAERLLSTSYLSLLKIHCRHVKQRAAFFLVLCAMMTFTSLNKATSCLMI